jgi:predicted nucleotidyltransferase
MPPTLAQIRGRKARRRRALERNLEKVRRRLVEWGALRIILFGSLARGPVNSRSDLDILAVMPPAMTGKEWRAKIYGEIDRDVDMDVLAFTPEELEQSLPVSGTVRNALRTGKVIHERGTP